MTTAAVFGSTGAVGSQILATLLATDGFSSIKTISRRLPSVQSPKLQAIQEADSSKWGAMISSLSPKPSVVFNAVGTTRAEAGGIQNQWKIDHDLCIENARAAKEAGVKTYVFISSAGTRKFFSSQVPYSKMKIGVEDAIKELDFEQAIILRPGMIIGREKSKAPMVEKLVENLHKISQGIQDSLGQDQTVIGRAAVAAARIAEDGKAPSKYWTVEMGDIIKLGRDEWKE
ncbi:hypothetical protein EIK77_007825 [Talaromyces pinophilus]|nr:hypothetical protein DPV78_006286 [Talaromyces pinophilus]KAI7968070.1 hypothetical protein EIK77_007825 [Talaromyces pinophilus]PCG91054.1 Hypothetical protein PENO1_095910 [Penicillium occitanis (nom. inval.)]PCG91436.1 hypothetical protein PENOC_097380 [Penicillium occitanis (nom. inval.)]